MYKKVLVLGEDGLLQQLQAGDKIDGYLDKAEYDPDDKKLDVYQSSNHVFSDGDNGNKIAATRVSSALMEIHNRTEEIAAMMNESIASLGNQIWTLTANANGILVNGVNK